MNIVRQAAYAAGFAAGPRGAAPFEYMEQNAPRLKTTKRANGSDGFSEKESNAIMSAYAGGAMERSEADQAADRKRWLLGAAAVVGLGTTYFVVKKVK